MIYRNDSDAALYACELERTGYYGDEDYNCSCSDDDYDEEEREDADSY